MMIQEKFLLLAQYIMATEDQNLLRGDTLAKILQITYNQGAWSTRINILEQRKEINHDKDSNA